MTRDEFREVKERLLRAVLDMPFEEYSATGQHRNWFIRDIRDLAQFLESRMPTPTTGAP